MDTMEIYGNSQERNCENSSECGMNSNTFAAQGAIQSPEEFRGRVKVVAGSFPTENNTATSIQAIMILHVFLFFTLKKTFYHD